MYKSYWSCNIFVDISRDHHSAVRHASAICRVRPPSQIGVREVRALCTSACHHLVLVIPSEFMRITYLTRAVGQSVLRRTVYCTVPCRPTAVHVPYPVAWPPYPTGRGTGMGYRGQDGTETGTGPCGDGIRDTDETRTGDRRQEMGTGRDAGTAGYRDCGDMGDRRERIILFIYLISVNVY